MSAKRAGSDEAADEPCAKRAHAAGPALSLATRLVHTSLYEACLASSEGGEFGLAFSSGRAATATVFSMLTAGDHVVTCEDVRGGTAQFMRRVAAPGSGLEFSFVDMRDDAAVEAAIRVETKILWVETPTSPELRLVDIARVAALAHQHKVALAVDNTLLSPALQQPLALGADLVVHSVSRYMGGGGGEVTGGAIVTANERLYERLQFLQSTVGAVPSALDCRLAARGLRTLHLRMREHSASALRVAAFLESHPGVAGVLYPGLESHPQHELARRTLPHGCGGVVSFSPGSGAARLLEHLRLVKVGAEHPTVVSHVEAADDGLLCLSVGLEAPEDVIADLAQALAAGAE